MGRPLDCMTYCSLVALLILSGFCSQHHQLAVRAQVVGIGGTLCACQPAVYEFTFNFDLTCEDGNVFGPGINETACLTEIRDVNGDVMDDGDEKPVLVTNIQIFELDQNLQVAAQSVINGNFLDGSTFTYTSIISSETSQLDEQTLPRGFQVVSAGVNNVDQSLINTYAILYENDCGIFPILSE